MHMCMAHVYVYCGTDGGDILVSISLIDTLSPLLLPLSLLILHCHLFVIVISLAPIHASIVTSHSCHSCLYLSYGHMDTLSPLFLPLSTLYMVISLASTSLRMCVAVCVRVCVAVGVTVCVSDISAASTVLPLSLLCHRHI